MDVDDLRSWLPHPAGAPALIAGPCSAETEAQVLDTARALSASGRVQAYRAGVWKPRTRPGGFAGLGDVALPWLVQVQQETGLPVAVEVATATHVDKCLKAGIRILWIGARTTVNPFSVQELADALRGVDVPVLVKNPVSPDLGLWIGALERLHLAGIRKLAAVHRGFSQYEPGLYRNPPEWQLPIELRRRLPGMPLLCDPSHIGGDAGLIQGIAQTAMDLAYDGLMIETHPNPPAALSDARQQITPGRLLEMLDSLIYTPAGPYAGLHPQIQSLRALIDGLDEEVVRILAARLELVSQIGEVKREYRIPILQLDRWEQVLHSRLAQAHELGIDDDLVRRLFQFIHLASIQVQERVVHQTTQHAA